MKRPIPFILTLWLLCLVSLQDVAAQLAVASLQKSPESMRAQEGITSLIALLKKLELIHKTTFVYQKELLENKTVVGSVNENDNLEQVLDRVLTPANLRFQKLKGGGFTILPRKTAKNGAPNTEVLKTSGIQPVDQEASNQLAVNTLSAKADLQLPVATKVADIVVKGKVTDSEKGEPVPGVTIVLKGAATTKGTNTDATAFIPSPCPVRHRCWSSALLGMINRNLPLAMSRS